MPKTTVINLKDTERPSTGYAYVGRPSKWGNPFVVGVDGSSREIVIQKYHQWLMGHRRAPDGRRPPSIRAIQLQLQGKTLGCWCAPLPCHGDVLAEIADSGEENYDKQ